MQTRIYKVVSTNAEPGCESARLVEATSAAQAIRHVVASEYSASVATTKEVAAAMNSGIKVEAANKPGHQPTTQGE